MSMPYCEASHLGNTTVLAMFVAVMVWASNRYRRKVTAMSKAGLGATRCRMAVGHLGCGARWCCHVGESWLHTDKHAE